SPIPARMPTSTPRPPLPHPGSAFLLAGVPGGEDHLQGDGALELQVGGPVDYAHAAATEQALDHVAPGTRGTGRRPGRRAGGEAAGDYRRSAARHKRAALARERTCPMTRDARLEAAFLKDVIDRPDDDAPRLAYADWLMERDDPARRARGEFIRLQCEM